MMPALVPAQSVPECVGLFNSAAVTEGVGPEVKIVGDGDFRHARKEIAERGGNSQVLRGERFLGSGTGRNGSKAEAYIIYEVRGENVCIVQGEYPLIEICGATKAWNRERVCEAEQIVQTLVGRIIRGEEFGGKAIGRRGLKIQVAIELILAERGVGDD